MGIPALIAGTAGTPGGAEPARFPFGHALRALPSPMEGITGEWLCHAATSLGLVDVWMAPFVRITDAAPSAAVLRRRLAPYAASGLPYVGQLLGSEPAPMALAAARMAEAGAAGVNINFACPSPAVVRNRGGGALLRTPSRMAEILRACRAALGAHPLSVKLRTGFFSPGESAAIARAAIDGGADWGVVHFRTVSEGYQAVEDGLARLAAFAAHAGGWPVVGNGDVVSEADARRMLSVPGVAGFAAGRGFLRDPGILRRLAPLPGAPPPPPAAALRRALLDTILSAVEERTGGRNWPKPFLLDISRMIGGRKGAFFSAVLEARSPAEARAKVQAVSEA